MGVACFDLTFIYRGKGIWSKRAGHHEEFAIFRHDHAADDDTTIFKINLFTWVLVADDLGRLHDVFREVVNGVAISRSS